MLSSGLLALLKGVAGVLGSSQALIADAIESLTDFFASLLVLLGLKYSTKPADKNHPYGHGKMEALTTFIIVAFMMFSSLFIVLESISNLKVGSEMPSAWTLILLGLIISWKELSYQYVIRKSVVTNSLSLKADAWHHRSDAITSLSAFMGIALALILGEGYAFLDDVAAIFAAIVILYNAYKIFRPALAEVMDEQVYQTLRESIRDEALKVEGVIDTEKCYVRKSGMLFHIDLHATVDANMSVREGHEIAHKLQDHLKVNIPNIASVLVHIEPDTY